MSYNTHGTSYSFTTIDVPDPLMRPRNTFATGINDHGTVVGASVRVPFPIGGAYTGFIDEKGTLSTITTNSTSSLALTLGSAKLDINDSGTLVGTGGDGRTITHRAFVDEKGAVTTINVTGALVSEAKSINASGTVVGFYQDAGVVPGSAFGKHGFIYENGSTTSFDAPNSNSTVASGINAQGIIVGTYHDADTPPDSPVGIHGFVDANGVFTTVDVPGADSTSASGVNAGGAIVGSYTDKQGTHGFVDKNGCFTTIDVPGASGTSIDDINARGMLVGSYTDSQGTHGFVASPEGGAIADASRSLIDLLRSQIINITLRDLVPSIDMTTNPSAHSFRSPEPVDVTDTGLGGFSIAVPTDAWTVAVPTNGG